MEKELKMAPEVYMTEARANLRREEYWHKKKKCCPGLHTGTTSALMKLRILTAAEYRPNLGVASDDERLLVIFQSFFILFMVLIFELN